MPQQEPRKYSTGEVPQYGDIVRGVPNRGRDRLAGHMISFFEDAICVLFVKPDGSGECVRVYGEVSKFEMIARNPKEVR